MQKTKEELDIAQKAVEQLHDGLKRGPILRLISILIVLLLVSIGMNIKFLIDSRDRELDLMMLVVEEVRKQAPGIVKEEVKPLKEQVVNIITKTDTTLSKTDSLLFKVDSLIKR